MAHAIIGDDTGLIKRIRLRDSAQVKWGTQSAERRINRLAWAGSVAIDATADEQIQQRESHVAVAMRDGKVELWNTETKEVEARFDALSLNESLKTQMAAINRPIDASKRAPSTANPVSQIAGMAVLQTAIAGVASNGAYERRLLTCSQEGVVHIRPFSLLGQDGEIEASEAHASAAKQKKGKKGSSPALSAQASPSSSSPISSTGVGSFVVGCDIHVLKVEPTQQQVFACGGKEHMLRIWDIATATATFKEKNVAHDMLNLRQQVWITDLAFIPGSGDKEIVTGTAFHQVRRYDTRVQKKPLFNVEVGDHAITCLDVSRDGKYVVLGDGGGRLQQRDLRMNARMVHVYHGIGGSVRGLAVHPTLPLLATCGLDRFLRVYDMNTRKQLSKIYLKQKLNAVLFSAQTPENARVQEAKQIALKKEEQDGDENMVDVDANGDGEDEDDVWGELNRKKSASAAASSSAAAGAKKRKHESEGDASQKKIKVKQEPVDEAVVPASSSFKVNPFSKIAASPANKKAGAAAVVQTKPGQIVFRQTVAFDADEDGEDDEDEDGEDEEGEDDDEEGEDDEGEDGEDEDGAEEDEEEEEEEPEPVKTPARKGRAPRQSTATVATPAPSSTRSLRSRPAPASATPATRSRK